MKIKIKIKMLFVYKPFIYNNLLYNSESFYLLFFCCKIWLPLCAFLIHMISGKMDFIRIK